MEARPYLHQRLCLAFHFSGPRSQYLGMSKTTGPLSGWPRSQYGSRTSIERKAIDLVIGLNCIHKSRKEDVFWELRRIIWSAGKDSGQRKGDENLQKHHLTSDMAGGCGRVPPSVHGQIYDLTTCVDVDIQQRPQTFGYLRFSSLASKSHILWAHRTLEL